MRIITIAWFFGAIWMSATAGTPLTNFAKALGASPFQFGVLAAIPFLASFLTLPGTLLIEATGQRKKIFLTFLYLQRSLWFVIAFVPLWIIRANPESGQAVAIALFLVLLFVMHAANAFGGPGWIGWMSDIIPPGVRGTYFSRRRQWGLISAIPAAWGAGFILDRYALTNDAVTVMTWCATIFVIAAVFGLLDIILFQWVPDIPTPPKKGNDLLSSWGEPLRNRNYLHFAGFVGTLVFAVGPMGQFITLYILLQLGADRDGGAPGLNQITQMMLIVAPSVAQLLTLHIWGKAADRFGKRPCLVLASIGLVPVGLAWTFVTADTIWLGYVLSALGGALWAGIDVVNFNIVLEFSGSAKKAGTRGGTAYVAVNSLIINIAGCVGGLAWGGLAEWLKDWQTVVPWIGTFTFFHVLFILSGVLRLLAVVLFLPKLHEPEARPTMEAFRYMTSNFYNNLFGAVMQPLRLIGFRGEQTEES